MRSLEEQSHFLSRDTSAPGTGKLYSLCEMLMEDLNNYCECMIPIDELNTLNIKLFPSYPPPPPVQAWHVPIFTIRPETLMDENWDITMQRIVPYINGVSSVKRIALLADADLRLTRQCMRHLLYYGCLLLLDIFSFTAIYAPTADFCPTIAKDEEMQRECARYINMAFAPAMQESGADGNGNTAIAADDTESDSIWPMTAHNNTLDGVTIVTLFAALRQGLSVREWYIDNSSTLANVDLRRFITFGVIKGFVYRVHKYAYATGIHTSSHSQLHHNPLSRRVNGSDGRHYRPTAHRNASSTTTMPRSMSSEVHFVEDSDDRGSTRMVRPSQHIGGHSSSDESDEDGISNDRLKKYLDGKHCFDQICTELELSERELLDRIKRYPGEVLVIHR